eukprot:3269183-Rhodomonas_salina.4
MMWQYAVLASLAVAANAFAPSFLGGRLSLRQLCSHPGVQWKVIIAAWTQSTHANFTESATHAYFTESVQVKLDLRRTLSGIADWISNAYLEKPDMGLGTSGSDLLGHRCVDEDRAPAPPLRLHRCVMHNVAAAHPFLCLALSKRGLVHSSTAGLASDALAPSFPQRLSRRSPRLPSPSTTTSTTPSTSTSPT